MQEKQLKSGSLSYRILIPEKLIQRMWQACALLLCVGILGCQFAWTIFQYQYNSKLSSLVVQQQEQLALLQWELDNLRQDLNAQVSQQEEFQEAMKAAAAKAGYWWAYVRMNRNRNRNRNKGGID